MASRGEEVAKTVMKILAIIAVALVLLLVGKHYIDKDMGGPEIPLVR